MERVTKHAPDFLFWRLLNENAGAPLRRSARVQEVMEAIKP